MYVTADTQNLCSDLLYERNNAISNADHSPCIVYGHRFAFQLRHTVFWNVIGQLSEDTGWRGVYTTRKTNPIIVDDFHAFLVRNADVCNQFSLTGGKTSSFIELNSDARRITNLGLNAFLSMIQQLPHISVSWNYRSIEQCQFLNLGHSIASFKNVLCCYLKVGFYDAFCQGKWLPCGWLGAGVGTYWSSRAA